jgi:hypothetical protein
VHYRIETPINPRMVDQLGKEQTVARLTLEAWHKAVYENQGLRSIRLLSVEERESTMFGSTVQTCRFTFQVD